MTITTRTAGAQILGEILARLGRTTQRSPNRRLWRWRIKPSSTSWNTSRPGGQRKNTKFNDLDHFSFLVKVYYKYVLCIDIWYLLVVKCNLYIFYFQILFYNWTGQDKINKNNLWNIFQRVWILKILWKEFRDLYLSISYENLSVPRKVIGKFS